jgi:transcription elongation GreA/GreB family factor
MLLSKTVKFLKERFMSKFLTRVGRDLLIQKISATEAKLVHVMSQKGDAYENGGNGWHDNFAYEQLIREEAMLAGQHASLKDILRNATIVPSVATTIDHVGVGCIIELGDDDGNSTEYEVAGYGETDLSASPKRLEYLAPIIEPFMDGVVGDEHSVRIAGKKTNLTLINIRRG